MKRALALFFSLLVVAPFGVAQDQKAMPPATSNVHQAPARDTYRLDYTITEMEDGKKVNARTYSIMCEDEGGPTRGVVKVGSRIPVATGSYSTESKGGGVSPLVNTQFTYLDIGVNIDARLTTTADGTLSLQSEIEMSSVAESTAIGDLKEPVIRQLKASTNNSIAVGKPIVISTADDVASHRQFQVQVVATRVK